MSKLSDVTRKLAAIMFTDMVGYSALAQKDESLSLRALERHRKLLRPIFTRYDGREVKTIGDSFLVEFQSALDATNCAIEIQRFIHADNLAAKGGEWKIQLRIGIHLGDVIYDTKVHRFHRLKVSFSAGDVLGDAVNIASRIEPLSDPEGVCISQQVYDQVKNKVTSPLVKIEQASLKNLQSPIDVYKIVMPWEGVSSKP